MSRTDETGWGIYLKISGKSWKVSGEKGEMDEFTQYFKGELDADEKTTYCERSFKEEMESLILVFSSRVQGCRFFQEEEGLFQSMPQDFFQIGREEEAWGSDMPGRVFLEEPQDGVVDDGLLLTNEVSQCIYSPIERTEELIRYIVCYTQDGIVCKRAGDSRALWKLPFGRTGDYDRVLIFLRNFDFRRNLPFSAHKRFWMDYLSGNLDQEEFMDFFARVENGVSIDLLAVEDGVYADREVQRYQGYFAHNAIADTRLELPDFLGDFLENPSQRLGWKENYQRWMREFVSLFEEEGVGGAENFGGEGDC